MDTDALLEPVAVAVAGRDDSTRGVSARPPAGSARARAQRQPARTRGRGPAGGGAHDAGAPDFDGRRILCIGDVMLDRFLYGKVDRISPEAPVPVVRLTHRSSMLGGVGNVARNIAALGGEAVVIGHVGMDDAGREVLGMLSGTDRVVNACVVSADRPTICKTRVIAVSQHMIRMDEETTGDIQGSTEQRVLAAIEAHLPRAGAVVLSDYAKGMLSPAVVAHAIALARRAGIPVLVDPKQPDMAYYRGATLITPNLKELAAAAGARVERDEDVVLAARRVMAQASVEAVLVTRSERGMTLVQGSGEVHDERAVAQEVYDVSGAGDTVIATLSLCLAGGMPLVDAMGCANAAAGVVVGKLGTATLTRDELGMALHDRRLVLQTA